MAENKEKLSDTKKAEGGKAASLLASFKKLDTKKRIQYAAVLLLIIVILLIYFSSFKSGSDNTPAATESVSTVSQYDDTEKKLEDTLSRIEGAGRVKVMITYETSPEIVPAFSEDRQSSSSTDTGEDGTSKIETENIQNEIVTVGGSGGSEALVLREISPVIRGVIVVAEGADDIGVRFSLLSAVETVLGVSSDQVDVYKMNN